MGRDTIQLEDAVSTISQEYLLEFASEYYIPENLHPEPPGPGDHIVDFPEGKNNRFFWVDEKVFPTVVAWRTAATKDDKPKANNYSVVDVATLDTHQMDLFNLIKASNPTKVKTRTRQRTAHEAPLDFSNEDAPPPVTQGAEAGVHEPTVTDDAEATEAVVDPDLEKEVISMGPTIKKRRRQRDAGEGGSNAPTKVLRRDHDTARAEHSARGGKSLTDMSVDTEPAIYGQETQEPPVARRDQRIATREKHIKDLEAQLEAEINMKKAAEVKNSEARVMGEEKIMAAFEVFKKHEDERVNARCVEMDARLDALSIDFDEELYPHMLTAIAGRRWVIGHRLRLAVMKYAESTELRQAFANVVSAGIAKGMSEGLKYGVEHGKAGLELTAVEAYDPEADSKYVAALHDLKDLNYPLIDELEQLKDAPLDLKIPVYPEVRDPRNPWACKEEILLEDAIAANISRAEKKKKNRVVCRTHGVGSAHHARSDGIPVSVPTVAPQGLQILLADAATQTEDEESPRLLRSKSLPPMFNLDWP
ncbi:hypothetical protein Tco_1004016 [Tanacetum coccineum]|uniref:Transposase (Putative), gypsy type n=1 Tax=Tanacetum coccineum TaxID=301880 RepID=A0ABQ5FC37_9ASTR